MADITDLNLYTQNLADSYTSAQKVAAMEKKAQALSKSGESKAEDETDEELMDVCKDFEAYLWEQVYKEMAKSTNLFSDQSDSTSSALGSSMFSGGDSYSSGMVNLFMQDALETVSSQSVAGGANSLAQSLYDQLKRQTMSASELVNSANSGIAGTMVSGSGEA
ncbi:MAG: hypothetical protein K6E33_02180 [Lachnospiraceae bacterium]|nr:hypothetical protein [Lachnospiraceae bacterium]